MSRQIGDELNAALDVSVVDADFSGILHSGLSVADRRRVLVEWNDTSRDLGGEFCLHRLVESQAAATPEAVAVVCGDVALSYALLNRRANRLAHQLRSHGVGPEALVALFAERSLAMVVGLLGILKAGGAYVPLDPDYPRERVSLMLGDAAPRVVLTQEHLKNQLPDGPWPVLSIDDEVASASDEFDWNPETGVQPENLAYVIYTSGSTGMPKGVLNTHVGICNRLLWMRDAYGLSQRDRVLQKTPFSFDVSVWEFFAPLVSGGRLVLARPGGHRDPSYLARLVEDAAINIIHFVPSMLQAFLDEPGLLKSCRSLEHLFTSGEALPEGIARRALKLLPCRLHNLYGPTEAAVEVTFFECRADDPPGPIPIGKPIANMRAYVLDASFQPLPVGTAGELFLGGIGVARGYLNRPELTAERFVRDPFDDRPGARLYRTGDLAQWRADGNIEFLGRMDDQVKLRGFRIELGEIECALAQHADIRQATVLLREDEPGDPRLVAYFIADDVAPDSHQLRDFLAQTLPDHMVPTRFVRLSAFPLNANGKLDRRALPAPETGHSHDHQGFVPPRSPIEQSLASIWQDVLGVPAVGVYDDFFDLGGHSLKATKATTQISGLFGIEVPARSVFDAPTIADMAALLAQLRAPGVETSLGPLAPIEPRPGGPAPLSFAQTRFWLADQLDTAPGAYNLSTKARLRGRVDVEALRQAIEAIVARHEPLRTTFDVRDGVPSLRIGMPERFELAWHDLRELDPAARERAIDERVSAAADLPFDLTRDLPLRATLVSRDADFHLLILTFHHVACDGWSVPIFWRELAAIYNAHVQRTLAAVAPLPISYSDYAAWQVATLNGERLERLLAYWSERLGGLRVLDLPTQGRRRGSTFRGASRRFSLPAALTGRLRALGRETGTTLNMVLLGALDLLLMRYSGQEDIAVGVPSAGRGRPELEHLIGVFVNTLVVRVDLAGNPTFRELLARVRTASLGAYDHQELPFEQLVAHLRPRRELGRPPLVQVVFQLLDLPPAVPELTGLAAEIEREQDQFVRFELELALWHEGQGLGGEILYRTDLFDDQTIASFIGCYQTVLAGVAVDLDRRVREIPLLSETLARRIVDAWNDTATAYPRERCVHQLFEDQSARAPGAIAVVGRAGTLTYGVLNSRANQLARVLRAMGIGTEDRVALRLGRSPEMIVALLGILKAGAAYLPLNPDDPESRVRRMADDAGLKILITDRAHAPTCPELGISVLVIDDNPDPLAGHDDTNLALPASPRSLAYVMCTSGSTGKPKGVLIENRSIVRLVFGTDYATFGPDRVFLQLAPLAFDASTFEIWGSLLHGARLVQASDGPPALAELKELVSEHGVTTLWLTAGLFNAIVESRPNALDGVTEILVGGEALSVRHVSLAYRALAGSPRIVNGYGPTESTTFACCHPIDPNGLDQAASIPIGRPIGNTRAYVFDERGEPVPPGVAGELYLGGDGLARGYLNQPGATAEKFVAGPAHAARLYRTGDKVRWHEDGTLAFLGRFDDQVKLRGFRIELGEIECALAQHADIRQATVLLREDEPGDPRLVAYFIADDVAPDSHQLRDFLAQTLPDHMVPTRFVRLSAFPLNANGKLDRRALPAPETGHSHDHQGFVPPRSPIEQSLASIWQDVLGVPAVGVYDDFFDLGGHSLRAMRLLARIDQELGVRLPISAVFHAGTIAAMASALEESSASPHPQTATGTSRGLDDPIVPLQIAGAGAPVFMVPGMLAHVISLRDLAILLGSDQPVYGLQPASRTLEFLENTTVEKLARELLGAMKRVAGRGPYHLLGFSAGGTIAYQMAQYLIESGEEVGLLGLLDTYGPGFGGILPLNVRIFRHVQLVGRMGPWAGLRYMLERSRARLERSWLFGGDAPALVTFDEMTIDPTATDPIAARWCDEVVGRHRRRPYLGRVDLFTADKPVWLGHDFEDPMMGWGPLVKGKIVTHRVPGDHLEMIKPPALDELAVKVRQALDEAADRVAARDGGRLSAASPVGT